MDNWQSTFLGLKQLPRELTAFVGPRPLIGVLVEMSFFQSVDDGH
jgi:hypothetical protein